MDWRTSLKQAFHELGRHRLRTLLTLLGMIFGVGAVVSMLAIGEGAEREALRAIEALGLRQVIVEAVPQPSERLKEVREDSPGLGLRDLEVAAATLPQVARHGALKEVSVYALFSDIGRSDARVLAVSPSHFAMSGLAVGEGRLFTEADDSGFAQVAVLGDAVARELFGTHEALGRRVKVNQLWFDVIGILAPRDLGRDEFEGVRLTNPSRHVHVPLRTARSRFRFKPMEHELDELRFEVQDTSSIASVASTLDRLLETRHGGIPDYRLIVPEALLEQHRKTQRIFDIVMASIAGISLLVGGIGIMNIMLATVLERTREIGVRRALGAKRSDVRRQFLTEAFTISSLGGLLGIAVGFGLAAGISAWSGWPLAWSPVAPLVAVGVCMGVGLGFGLYPAVQASKLDPIEALNRSL